jgi:hypothetical protein
MTTADKKALLIICERYGVAEVIRFCAQLIAHQEDDIHYGIETRSALCKIAKGLSWHSRNETEKLEHPTKG